MADLYRYGPLSRCGQADVLLLGQIAPMERDIDEAANHPCKVKKNRARTDPHFHSSGAKTQGCSDRLVKMVRGMLGNAVSAHWSRKLWI